MQRLAILLLTLVFAMAASTSHSDEDDLLTTIEGHVFNKFTGVPLQGAVVEFVVLDELGEVLGSGTAHTDPNGFYSFDVNVNLFVRIEVSCLSHRGEATSSVSPPSLGPEIVRRDAYVNGPDRRSFTTCISPAA